MIAAVDQVEAPGLSMVFRRILSTDEETRVAFGGRETDAGTDRVGPLFQFLFVQVRLLVPGTAEVHHHQILFEQIQAVGHQFM